jgi:hypothetical protein
MTAFSRYIEAKNIVDGIGLIELGASCSYFAFFYKKEPVLIRKYDFGLCDIYERVENSISVDRETAIGIVSDSSFDISQLVKDASEQFVKQIVISKHFVERRENCAIKNLFVPSGVGISKDLIEEIKVATSTDIASWQAFDVLERSSSLDLSEFESTLWRFNSAVGTGIGYLSHLDEEK